MNQNTNTNFKRVARMNVAFGNPEGDACNIDVDRLRSQCRNILDEFCELQIALGAAPETVAAVRQAGRGLEYGDGEDGRIKLDDVRDALGDIHVFAYGAHHFMGLDADKDVGAIIDALASRFIKDEADKVESIEMHARNGVTEVYFDGDYPVMVMKSAVDQPDAPRGKFLKSASYRKPFFESVICVVEEEAPAC